MAHVCPCACLQVSTIANLVREYQPDAEVICELGVNLGHSASTIITALNNPRRFVGFDYNDATVRVST